MDNLLGVGDPRPEEDELEKLRKEQEEGELRRKKRGQEDGISSGTSSFTVKRKKKKDKKKKKKVEKEKEKDMRGATKDLTAVFGGMALDPSPQKRRAIKKKAKKTAKKRRQKGGGSSSTGGSSSGSSGSPAEVGRLFGDEIRVKTVWTKHPGALTLNTVEAMQTAVVMQSGQPWDLDLTSIPPIFSQYWRLVLQSKMSGPMGREAQTLCYLQDLLQGRISSACDVATQRLKSLEQISGGGHFTIAQRQELVPLDNQALATPVETLEASRLYQAEVKARVASSRPWERRQEGDRKGDDAKGKGKNRDFKGKGKGRSENGAPAGGAKDDGRGKK